MPVYRGFPYESVDAVQVGYSGKLRSVNVGTRVNPRKRLSNPSRKIHVFILQDRESTGDGTVYERSFESLGLLRDWVDRWRHDYPEEPKHERNAATPDAEPAVLPPESSAG